MAVHSGNVETGWFSQNHSKQNGFQNCRRRDTIQSILFESSHYGFRSLAYGPPDGYIQLQLTDIFPESFFLSEFS